MSSSLKSRNSNSLVYSYVGVDVSKDKLDFFISESKEFITIANNENDIQKFIKSHLSKLINPLVTCESTGGWGRVMLLHLASHNIDSHVAHATKIYHYAKSKGILAKTDKLDATTIASFAVSEKLQPSTSNTSDPVFLEFRTYAIPRFFGDFFVI